MIVSIMLIGELSVAVFALPAFPRTLCTSGKPLMILGLILLLGGIQLITIGILAEVNVRTYYESQNKKTYQVRNIYQTRQAVKPVLGITV